MAKGDVLTEEERAAALALETAKELQADAEAADNPLEVLIDRLPALLTQCGVKFPLRVAEVDDYACQAIDQAGHDIFTVDVNGELPTDLAHAMTIAGVLLANAAMSVLQSAARRDPPSDMSAEASAKAGVAA